MSISILRITRNFTILFIDIFRNDDERRKIHITWINVAKFMSQVWLY